MVERFFLWGRKLDYWKGQGKKKGWILIIFTCVNTNRISLLIQVSGGVKGRANYEKYCAPLLNLAGMKVMEMDFEKKKRMDSNNIHLRCNLWPFPKELDLIWNHIMKYFCLNFMKMVNKSCPVQQMTEKITLEVDAKIRFLWCESLGWQGTRDVYSLI